MLLHVCNTLTVPYEKTKRVSFFSYYMKNIAVLPARFEFPVNLMCCIGF